MAYDQEFYRLYADYLAEPRVRAVHDMMFRAAIQNSSFQRVLDLGCGQGNEFFHHARPAYYVGVDRNAPDLRDGNRVTVPGDYRHPAVPRSLAAGFNLTAAVSLFSIECTAPCADNDSFYNAVLKNPAVTAILASGFYYLHAKGEEKVSEAGDIVSWQTPETFPATPSAYDETRVAVACPSNLFGEDVIEVWRLLTDPSSQTDRQFHARFAQILRQHGLSPQTRFAGSVAPAPVAGDRKNAPAFG